MNLAEMTPRQQEAVISTSPSILVVAGPGSGKTATTIARIKDLIETGADPSRIVALTFTNAAAKEMQKRLATTVSSIIDYDYSSLGYCGTLHGFAMRCLKQHGNSFGYGDKMSIISPESAADILANKAKGLGSKLKIDDLLKLKAKGRPAPSTRLSVDQLAVAEYYQELAQASIVDFDLILTEFAALLENPVFAVHLDFDHLFVDEVQDSAPIDWEIYHALPIANKFFVGDPDQSIYAFRGADINGMLRLAQKPGTHLIRLETNFRSNAEICQSAQRLIEHNRNRIDKRTISNSGPGGAVLIAPPAQNEGAEQAQIVASLKNAPYPHTEIAVLCRTNAIAYAYGRALEAAGIPVTKQEKSDLPKDWPLARSLIELLAEPENDVLAYLFIIAAARGAGMDERAARQKAHEVRRNASAVGQSINQAFLMIPRPNTAVEALGSAMSHGISAECRMLLAEIVREIGPNESVLDLALHMGSKREQVKETTAIAGIHVLTIHAAKGREFDCVFLAGWEDEVIPGQNADPTEIEEERRLAYVGLTRARYLAMITHATNRTTSWGAIATHKPSRFITEIEELSEMDAWMKTMGELVKDDPKNYQLISDTLNHIKRNTK